MRFDVDRVVRHRTFAAMQCRFPAVPRFTGNAPANWLTAGLLLVTVTGSLVAQTTPNDFFKRGTPTFIVGTQGDDRADRAIKAQAAMIRDLLFPTATIIDDSAVDPSKGPANWPAIPILYGGPHVHDVLAKLSGFLPFRMERGKLAVGDQLFDGDDYRLITVIPARPADKDGPGYPEFLLYAGSGMPGVAEINAVRHGGEPILIADAFGRLLAGRWEKSGEGTVVAAFMEPPVRRIAWRSVVRELKRGSPGRPLRVEVHFPQQLPPGTKQEPLIEACLRGLRQAADKLDAVSGTDLSIYIYPDLGSIASLTGQRGDGHAVVEGRVLHVVASDPRVGGACEKLVAHEGAHILAYEDWGAAGTPMMGEGVAVWASSGYGGTSLTEWKRRIEAATVPPIASLLGKSFRQMPENQSYPLAGVFVEMSVEKLGVAKVRQHLYGATASNWDSACKAAGTTSPRLEATFRTLFGRR